MRADDDGFVGNTKRVMKIVGASEDDLKLLIAKRFLLVFEDGVIVIKHWRMHNTLSKSRYHETQYLDEKAMLKLKDNGAYSFENGQPIDDTKTIGMYGRRTSGEQVENADLDLGLDLDKDIKKDNVGKAPTSTAYKTIIEYLNEKTNAHYRHTTKSTQRIINGRLSDGFSVDDFKLVIDIKSSQWIGDKKMSAYLRPETLFAASHFESYLNEARQAEPKKPKYSGLSEKMAAETAAQVGGENDYGDFK
jgi:uncharacterized phage protein (TIGR02220 family)